MLPQAGFLKNASPALRRTLEALASDVRLKQGQVLFERGDDGDALFAVIEGALEISVHSEDGRKLALAKMSKGDLLGEIALFDPGPRTASAMATTPTHVLKIRNGDVIAAVRSNPDLGIDLIRLAGERLRWMNLQIGEQAFLPIAARLARKILYLLDESDGVKQNVLPMSQANLAEFVGATREAVSKTLSEWKKEAVVDVSRGTIRVLDRDTLSRIADLDLI
ncbi:Crp/Fnr family transcriptional regulator [Ovoidimarina sediminis]|uniref:Crp/Fnr family transcriptional regulator n=1 Tax=Ovoidimarina sediminis TaxID=3079856 RepID=UPI0029083E61|nr:Crp/Fnr family transcriptional regulator [Rhodophyticola sp. MJ-SS7]MDU8945686.1 Crp/Fnr family transcriptional regulator [Rhodophyticola sp. MJ-SS7]